MEETTPPKQPDPSTFRDTITAVSGCLMWILLVVGGFVVVIAVFKGTPWIAEHIYPWALAAAGIATFVVAPISLILAIFKRSRPIAGAALFGSSYFIGICLWIWSLIVAYSLAGIFWMIVGVFLGGVGIVPIAFIAAALKSEWYIAGQIFVMAIITYGLRTFGLALADVRVVRPSLSGEQEHQNLRRIEPPE